MTKKTATTRVQLELTEKAHDRLVLLREKTEATSYAEVIKNALRLYDNLVDQATLGRTLCVRNPDGTLIEYAIFV